MNLHTTDDAVEINVLGKRLASICSTVAGSIYREVILRRNGASWDKVKLM